MPRCAECNFPFASRPCLLCKQMLCSTCRLTHSCIVYSAKHIAPGPQQMDDDTWKAFKQQQKKVQTDEIAQMQLELKELQSKVSENAKLKAEIHRVNQCMMELTATVMMLKHDLAEFKKQKTIVGPQGPEGQQGIQGQRGKQGLMGMMGPLVNSPAYPLTPPSYE